MNIDKDKAFEIGGKLVMAAVAGAFTVIGQHYMEKMLKKIEQPKPEDVTTEAIVQS